jgi:hypothetical protein
MHLPWLIQPGVEEIPSRMRPAAHRDDPTRRFLDHRLISRIGHVATNPLPSSLTDLGRLPHGGLEGQRPVVNDRTHASTWGARA